MIEVSVEVSNGADCSYVRIRAESIERAVDLAKRRYDGREVRVLFPIEPEAFFVNGSPLAASRVGL